MNSRYRKVFMEYGHVKSYCKLLISSIGVNEHLTLLRIINMLKVSRNPMHRVKQVLIQSLSLTFLPDLLISVRIHFKYWKIQ